MIARLSRTNARIVVAVKTRFRSNGGDKVKDGRYEKLLKYRDKLNSFDYAGLKREEALDLLRLGFRLYEDSEHMNVVKNRIQKLESIIEKQRKEIVKLKRKEESE
jgi:ppGpp synthetase/RelA/SpoT-type nucleotidyltranferase